MVMECRVSWGSVDSLHLEEGGLNRGDPAPRGHWAMSGDICGCHAWRCFRHGVGGGQGCHSGPCSAQDSQTSEELAPNVHST